MTIGYAKQVTMENDIKYTEISIRMPFIQSLTVAMVVNKSKTNNEPDYNLYMRFSRKGENFDSTKVGALWKKKSKKGADYLSGQIESPIFSGGKIYISLVTPLEENKGECLFTVLWSPPQANSSNYANAYSTNNTSDNYTTTHNGTPVEVVIDDEEIPF